MPTEIKAAFIGFCGTIIAAVIAFVSVIITLKCKKRMKLSTEQSFARFLTQKDCLKEIIANVESISAYTVNSHEIYNKLNTIFEQNPMIAIERVTLLVRKKADEKSKDIDLLNQNIELWKVLVQKQKIKNLTIIAYDHDPDHYYTLRLNLSRAFSPWCSLILNALTYWDCNSFFNVKLQEDHNGADCHCDPLCFTFDLISEIPCGNPP